MRTERHAGRSSNGCSATLKRREKLRTRGGLCLRLIPLHARRVHSTARRARCGLRSANRFDHLITSLGTRTSRENQQLGHARTIPYPASGQRQVRDGAATCWHRETASHRRNGGHAACGRPRAQDSRSIIPPSVDHLRDFQKGGKDDTGSRIIGKTIGPKTERKPTATKRCDQLREARRSEGVKQRACCCSFAREPRRLVAETPSRECPIQTKEIARLRLQPSWPRTHPSDG